MSLRLRHAVGMARTLASYTLRTGRWWTVVLLIGLAAAVALAATTQAAVPTAVYTLF